MFTVGVAVLGYSMPKALGVGFIPMFSAILLPLSTATGTYSQHMCKYEICMFTILYQYKLKNNDCYFDNYASLFFLV